MNETFNRPAYVDLRPLSKGMDLESPPHLLEVGAFRRLQNVGVRRGGLERRGGFATFYTGLKTLDRKVLGSPLWYDADGSPIPLLVTAKHVYRLDEGPTLTLVSPTLHDDETAGVIAAVADDRWQLTKTGATYLTTVQAGDTLWLSGEPYEILTVTNTVLTFRDHLGTMAAATGVTFDIVEGFRRVPDWTITRDFADSVTYFIWTDNSGRPLRRYDGTTVDGVDLVGGGMTEVDAVTTFGSRLWAAGMSEGGVDERFRIRWTTVTNQAEFPVSQYLDLPLRRYGVSRLLPLGNLLVAYFRDGIYFGRPTNIVNLPYDFSPYDTGNVGLVGPRAVTSWLDAHWFVGQDDIYSFSASRALERIGTKVIKETIQSVDAQLEDTVVVPDPVNERILFQFYDNDGMIRLLWAFYYKTGAWSTEDTAGAATGYFYGRTVSSLSWEELEADSPTMTWEDPFALQPWYNLRPVASEETLFRARAGQLDVYYSSQSRDTATSSDVPVVVESGDFDFGKPNIRKTVTQLSVKMEQIVPADVVFTVLTSTNRTSGWKSAGTLTIRAGTDEGKVDFRSTGSLFRFRLQSTSDVVPWTLNEVVMTAVEVGRESVFG